MSEPGISPVQQPNQAAVYRRYLQLQSLRAGQFSGASPEDLAGLLLACIGFGVEGAELALATTIAGGAFLGIDPSSEHLKAAVRNASCDFMVNTLDESLRVLKNELRKKKALSVGLLGEASILLPEIVERGVQPDLVAAPGMSPGTSDSSQSLPALQQLVERGAVSVDTQAANPALDSGFIEVTWTAANLADLRRLDQLALQQLPVEDAVRHRWLQHSSSSFHRQRPLRRILGFQADGGLEQFLHVLKNAAAAKEFQSGASVEWQTADGSKEFISLG